MSTTSSRPTETAPALRRRVTLWPLWATLAGGSTLAALFCEARPDGSGDFDYPLVAEDILTVDSTIFRVGGVLGYVAAILLLVLAAVWNQRVVRRFPDSVGAPLVTYAAIASAALSFLAFGWRGALGDYLPGGPEEDTYDLEGLYNYWVMNDFSPYIAGVPLLAAGFALTWMAFGEGLVSRPLGAAAGLFAALLLGAVVVTGVPGLPGMMHLGIAVGGVWLAFGRSAITAPAPAATTPGTRS